MILNIKQLIFEQLSQIDDNTNQHQVALSESISPPNIARDLNRNQHGDFIMTEDGSIILHVDNTLYMVEFNEDLSLLDINDSIYGKIIVSEQYVPMKNDLVTNYIGGGTISEMSGIDFEFESPCLEGKYFLEERTGMTSSVKMTRLL